MRTRRGVGEVVGSVSMLAITIALLSGASLVAVFSITDASALVQGAGKAQERDVGMLFSVVSTQTNRSGTYVWLYDYGWTSAPVRAVYLAGRAVQWSSSCPDDWSGSLCAVRTPPVKGELTLVIGGVSIAASV